MRRWWLRCGELTIIMSPEYVLPVLYDLALTIGSEVRLKPLLTKVLQRLLYHTSFPAGMVLLDISLLQAGETQVEARVGAAVGDFRLIEQAGSRVRLPAALLHGGVARQENAAALLDRLGNGRYQSFLRLPLEGEGVVLLLAPVIPETELPLLHMFQPVMAHFGNAIRLCRESEARTEELIDASRSIEAQRRLMTSVYESAHAGVMITDDAGKIIAANPVFSSITGYSSHEVLGQTPHILSSGRHDHGFYQAMWRSITEQGFWQGEIWNRRKSGEVYPEWLSITRVYDEAAGTTHYVGIFSDITEQKAAQQKIEHMAHHDQLTGLPNRLLLNDRFSQIAASAMRDKEQVALLFLDLDNFKYINDAFGHAMGDRLLCLVARRLHQGLRESDILSRLGGDEFVVVLPGVKDVNAVIFAAEKIAHSLRDPFGLDQNVFHIGVSIGISMYPADAGDFDTLLKQADMAMYHAKEAGRNTFHFFTQSMNLALQERLGMEQRLHRALDNGEFLLHYQAQFEFASDRIVGAEALLRWCSADGALVSPAQFIPLAEECGLIIPIGEWVMREACLCAQRWRKAGWPDVRVAVNISAVQLKRGGLVQAVSNALAESGLPPGLLELELTESMLIQDTERTLETVHKLKSLGVKLSLDDFGTGYSNLAYLKRLHVDKLKIDQSFVREMTASEEASAIVRAMVEMGRSLKLGIVAEGVEVQAQAACLKEMGCSYAQGYLFCRPMPEPEFTSLLGDWKNQGFLASRS